MHGVFSTLVVLSFQASNIAKVGSQDTSTLAEAKAATEKIQNQVNRLIEAASANQCA